VIRGVFLCRDSLFAPVTINVPCTLEKMAFLNFAFSAKQETTIPQPFSQLHSYHNDVFSFLLHLTQGLAVCTSAPAK
jgi:hypothetical protein